MRNFAFIPARGGSKRIPKKNIRLFRNKPMIAWSIEAAKNSNCFDEIFVSTDSKEIARISENYGAKVPFLRSCKLSDDFTPTYDVVFDFIKWTENEKIQFDNLCCIYATAPFTEPNDIKNSFELLKSSKNDSYVFVATSFHSSIFRSFTINDYGFTEMIFPENYERRSQDFKDVFHDAGQFYWGNINTWKKSSNILQNSIPYLIPRWRTHDIDTEEDWKLAELMHNTLIKIKDD